MSNRNCPNCGAPYDPTLDTCPYCKTSYFDLTAIDISRREPFYLKLKFDGMIFTSKVVVGDETSIEVREDSAFATDTFGNKLAQFVTSRDCDVNVSFRSVPDEHGALFAVRLEDKC